MPRVIKLNILLLLLPWLVFSSGPEDSLVRFADLKFRDDFESAAFREYATGGKNASLINLFLNPFLSVSSVNRSMARAKVEEAVKHIKTHTEGMSEPKQVKYIYKYIHQQFFSRYNLQNSFDEIFEKGEYNCVSGSALYAIVFSRLNIPYLVMEAPQHVYLMAYPQTHRILVESTSPENGYLTFNDAYVQRYVRYLHKSKQITDLEFREKSAIDIFNKHYYNNNGLSAFDLAAIQYCNYTVYHSEDKAYAKALEESKKAYFLWPNERSRYMLLWALSSVCGASSYATEQEVENLLLLCRLNNSGDGEISNEHIKFEFEKLLKTQLKSNSDYALAERSFNAVCAATNDTSIKNDIGFSYHYHTARLGYLNQKNKTYEFEHLKAAYQINPKDADLRTLIKSYFVQLGEKNEEPQAIIKSLDEFSANFGFLKTDEAFTNIKANCYLQIAYQHIVLNSLTNADKYLGLFEQLCSEVQNVQPIERNVELAYASVASYHYKRGNLSKTREYLKRGLKYAPENFGLQRRLSEAR